ncbi:hypothetical protein NECAME_11492 [Necator americanus]|uniref:Uncharacterized protein n=1 Tax=Necator americanus TaxID=51031 RepID=W2T6X8_NECAM|nr:hypothetical protein NECAME_11492 [Necator americanus]ETN76747.1 hypothetical protein NECAME_11492 [Necator americanus]
MMLRSYTRGLACFDTKFALPNIRLIVSVRLYRIRSHPGNPYIFGHRKSRIKLLHAFAAVCSGYRESTGTKSALRRKIGYQEDKSRSRAHPPNSSNPCRYTRKIRPLSVSSSKRKRLVFDSLAISPFAPDQ